MRKFLTHAAFSIALPVRLTLYISFRPVNKCCVVCLAPAVCVFPARLASLRLPPLLIHDTSHGTPFLTTMSIPLTRPPCQPAPASSSYP